MRNLSDLDAIKNLFEKKKVLELNDFYKELGTKCSRSVSRYLNKLNHLTSYTHAGKYYTLLEIAQFDQDGLWHYGEIGFSKHGTLLNTLAHFVIQSEAGKTNSELENQFRIRVQNSLLKLIKINKIGREKLEKKTYLYISSDPDKGQKQIKKRKEQKKIEHLSDWTVIEIFLETIRASSTSMNSKTIANRLKKRGSLITYDQVEHVFQKYGLEKKTLD